MRSFVINTVMVSTATAHSQGVEGVSSVKAVKFTFKEFRTERLVRERLQRNLTRITFLKRN